MIWLMVIGGEIFGVCVKIFEVVLVVVVDYGF